MIRRELYEHMFDFILEKHSEVFNNIEEIKDTKEGSELSNELSDICEINCKNPIILRLIRSLINLSNEEDLYYEITYKSQKESFESHKKREFSYVTKDLCVINCSEFSKDEDSIDVAMPVIEKIFSDTNSFMQFLDYIIQTEDKGINDYYVVYDVAIFEDEINPWKLYMFGLCNYMNNGKKLSYNPDLNYKIPSQHLSNFQYNTTAKYDQYLDIYDVFSEWNSCTDVLSAFLKMYQILEYMIYRKEFVLIT